jgi:hypothetical protein
MINQFDIDQFDSDPRRIAMRTHGGGLVVERRNRAWPGVQCSTTQSGGVENGLLLLLPRRLLSLGHKCGVSRELSCARVALAHTARICTVESR